MRGEYRHRARLCLFGLLSLAVMALIFCLSAQNGPDSGRLSSGFLASPLGRLLTRVLPRLTDRGEGWDIRKYAHMSEYGLLGASAFLFLAELFRWQERGRAALMALAFSFLYACSDELHQLFVPGRGGCFPDVLVDSAGYTGGVLMALAGARLAIRKKNVRSQRRFDGEKSSWQSILLLKKRKN